MKIKFLYDPRAPHWLNGIFENYGNYLSCLMNQGVKTTYKNNIAIMRM